MGERRRRCLVAAGALAALLAAGGPLAGAAPGPATRVEAAITARINAIRREHGLPPLRSIAAVAAVARAHSRRMSGGRFFAHRDPAVGDVADRLTAAGLGYRAAGENIAEVRGARDPAGMIVDGWMRSPGHRANILRGIFTETGVGAWDDGETLYVTQVFRRP